MKENYTKQNFIIGGSIVAALLFVFLFSKIVTKPSKLKEPHEIENVINFSALPTIRDCDLLLSFGSFGGGIDYKAHSKVVRFIRNNNSIKSIKSYANGREGEHILCLETKETTNNRAMFKAIRKNLPAFSNKGYSTLEMRGVKKFETKWK